MTETIDYNKLSNMIREIIREELEEIRPLNPDYVKKIKDLEKESSISFNSIDELDNLIENA